MITLEEIIEETKATLTKTASTNSNEKTLTQGKQILYFTHLFINYHIIIDSCLNLLLPDKISSKTKALPYTSQRTN